MGSGYNPSSQRASQATAIAPETPSYSPSAPVAPAPSGRKTYQVNPKPCTLHSVLLNTLHTLYSLHSYTKPPLSTLYNLDFIP